MNHTTSSDGQLSDSTIQEYTSYVSEGMASNRNSMTSKSTVHCNTVRVSGSTLQNYFWRVTGALMERASQKSKPTVPMVESKSRNNTEYDTNAPKTDKHIPPSTNTETFTNSAETTTKVVSTTQQSLNFSASFNTTDSTNVSTSASANVNLFWLSKMTGGTTTTVQVDTSSHPDGMATH